MADLVAPWWPGASGDHLYQDCPGLRRLKPQPRAGFNRIDPEGGDICGTCLRWWRSRNRAEVEGRDG